MLLTPEDLSLVMPTQGQVDTPDQLLGGQVCRLDPSYDRFDDVRGQKGEGHQVADIACVNPFDGGYLLDYDGLCPFCSRYVMLYRIRQLVQQVHLIDARSEHPLVKELSDKGFD